MANPADESLSLGDISGATDTKTAFFLLKAPTSSSSLQSHTVRIFLGKPKTTGATEQYSCTFSFVKIAETIKAQANKINSITRSTSAYVLGANMTVVVDGDCGTVGTGTSLDGDMIWISPVARSTWPTQALRLVSTRLKIDDSQNLGSLLLDKTDILQVKSLRALIGGPPNKCYYEATYTFKIIGTTQSAVSLSPIAQISSGTQIKHTDMSGAAITGQTPLPTNTVSIAATVAKSIATGTTQTDGKTNLNYTITLTNSNSSNSLTFDEVVDTPDTGVAYVSGSVRVSGAAAAEPVTDSAGKLIFSQPIIVNANSTKTITYTMREVAACTTSTSIVYSNSAIGKVGAIQIGSSSTSYSVTRAAGTCGTSNLTDTSTTSTAFSVEAVTYPATSIANTSAILNGTVDPNSLSGQTISFQYGTSSVLSTSTTINLSATTTSASTPYGVNTSITGLSTGTVYYFRIKVGSVFGSILSFVTTEPVANPTATTTNVTAVTNVSGGGAGGTYTVTFNGTVDANQVAGGSGAKFEYAQDGTQSSSATCATQESISSSIVYELNEDGSTSSTPLNLTGSFPVEVFTTQTSLVASKYYCYRTVATYSTSSTANGSWVSFYTGSFSSQTINFAQIITKSTSDTHTLTATATSTLPVSYQSNSPSVCTISGTTVTFLIGGTCSITASQGGNYQFYPAEPVTVNFLVTAPTRTLTFDNNTGAGTMTTQSANTPTSIKLNTFTKTGFTFIGWSTTSGSSSVTYIDGQEYNFSADLTLYAQWSANTYTITYKAGTGGSGSDVLQNFTFGDNPNLHTNTTTGFTNVGKVATGWNEAANGSGSAWAFSAPYTTAANLTLYAQWAIQYTVTFNDNYTSPTPLTTTQSSHVAANLTSNPWTRSGYTFGGWATSSANATAGTVAYANNASYPFTSSTTLYAIWSVNSYTFAYDSNTATSGSAPSGGGSKNFGATITVNSNTYSKTDHRFDRWYTTANGTGGTPYAAAETFAMPAQSVTLFAQWTRVYTVTLGALGGGSTSTINITTSPAAAGETVSLAIAAQSGYRLVTGSLTATYGSDTSTISGSGPYTFTMPAANVVITANFELIPAGNFNLTVTPGVGGRVSAGSGAISLCTSTSGTCVGSYASASSVVLTATPATGYIISSWGGVCSGSGDTCTVYMDNDKTASITFIAIFTLTFTPTTGNGSVSSSPAGINNCGTANSACTATYNTGTSVTLTASPSSGYKVDSWTGACSGSTTTCTLAMTTDRVVGISYVITYTVTLGTLTNAGTGTILIDTSPATVASTITLTVQPEAGKQLKSGTLEAKNSSNVAQTLSGTGPYTFTMPASNVTVTAEFEATPAGTYTITINSATGGSGSSSAATVSSGGSVTLTATASSGYTFSGWNCTGGGSLSSTTTNPATLSNITSNASCTPTFTQNVTTNNNSGGGGGGIAPRAQNRIVVSRVINTQAPTVITGQRPVINGTSTTLTPGNSANRATTITPTASTATSNNGGVIVVVTNNSSVAATPTTPGQAQISATNTNAGTVLEKRDNLPSSVNIERSAQNGIQVSTTNGWTGRVAVAVVNGDSDSDVESFIEVVIAPTPITAPQINQVVAPPIQRPEERPRPGLVITWNPSTSDVVGYLVRVNSEAVCFTMSTSCEVNQLIGPKTKVEVLAQGNDNTFSASSSLPAFKPTKPIPALVVNFAVASSILSPKFKTDLRNLAKVMVKEGFTKVDITGHTDSTGQRVSYDNKRLSDARAKATLNYLKRFAPKIKSVTGSFAFDKRITSEANPEELYTNRRAEVGVS